jgi:YbbR domain-containing protein
MNHTNRIILCVFLFLILFVILKYINSLQKKPIIKDNENANKKGLGQNNNDFYYDDGGNDDYSYPDQNQDTTYTYTESNMQ